MVSAMARTPESSEKEKVKAYLKAIGAYQFWPVPSGYGRQGVDCYACHRGTFIAIEVKAPGQQPTARQTLTLQEVYSAGGVPVAGTAVEIIDVLRHRHEHAGL